MVWAVVKSLNRKYFGRETQNTTTTANDYFPKLSNTAREYDLPKDFSSMLMVEVLDPVDYTLMEFRKMDMRSEQFRSERYSANAITTGGTAEPLIAGEMNYDIVGPDDTGRQRFVLSRFPPVSNLEAKLWYIRFLPDFSVPLMPGETVSALLAPYVDSLVTYATQSLIQSENRELGGEWEKDWRMDLEQLAKAADERSEADVEFVEEFGTGAEGI
jgi:hypothetical protein